MKAQTERIKVQRESGKSRETWEEMFNEIFMIHLHLPCHPLHGRTFTLQWKFFSLYFDQIKVFSNSPKRFFAHLMQFYRMYLRRKTMQRIVISRELRYAQRNFNLPPMQAERQSAQLSASFPSFSFRYVAALLSGNHKRQEMLQEIHDTIFAPWFALLCNVEVFALISLFAIVCWASLAHRGSDKSRNLKLSFATLKVINFIEQWK